jgi:hypothetical protein
VTNARQIKKLVQPLLEKHSDLVLDGRIILIKPLRHVYRGILIDRGFSAESFRPAWIFYHFFEPHHPAQTGWGSKCYGARRNDWSLSNSHVEGDLVELAETSILPLLRSINSLEVMATVASVSTALTLFYHETYTAFVLRIALGQFDMAREMMPRIQAKLPSDEVQLEDSGRRYVNWIRSLCRSLEREDLEGLAQTLHELEAQTARNWKLEHLWEPSPFAFEEGSVS